MSKEAIATNPAHPDADGHLAEMAALAEQEKRPLALVEMVRIVRGRADDLGEVPAPGDLNLFGEPWTESAIRDSYRNAFSRIAEAARAYADALGK